MHMLLILLTLCLRKPYRISRLFSIAYAFAGNGCTCVPVFQETCTWQLAGYFGVVTNFQRGYSVYSSLTIISQAIDKKGWTVLPASRPAAPTSETDGPSPPRTSCCHSSLTGAAVGHLGPPLPHLEHGERRPGWPLFQAQKRAGLPNPLQET